MKPIWVWAGMLLGMSHVMGQGVTLETHPVNVRYLRMPDKPLDAAWSQYHIEPHVAQDPYTSGGVSSRDMIFSTIRLEGYKLTQGDADITLEVHAGPLSTPAETLKSRRTSTIDKDGREHILHEFYYEVKYTFPLSCRISQKDGSLVNEIKIFDLTDDQLYKTGVYKQDRELDAWWRTNKNQKLSELKAERLKEGLSRLQSRLNELHGYLPMENQIRLETIGKKKHPAAESYDEALRQVAAAFMNMNAHQPLDAVRTAVQMPVDFYTTQLMTLDASDKEHAKLRHICLLNLALISFWLEDFEAAGNYASQMLKSDPKDKDAQHLIEDIQNVKSSLKESGRTSRHGL